MWKALKTESILCMCNLCSLLVPEHAGSVHFKLQPHGSWPLSDSPSYVTKVCADLLSHVVAYLFKRAMSPNKSNSCSFGDTNISIMTSVFCLHLHNQRGEKETERETEDGCCLLWLLCGCCRFGGGGTVERLMKPSQVGTNGAEWECLIWSGLSLDRRHSIAEREIQ